MGDAPAEATVTPTPAPDPPVPASLTDTSPLKTIVPPAELDADLDDLAQLVEALDVRPRVSLRDYQLELVETVWKHFASPKNPAGPKKPVLIHLPTGGGKTVIASEIIQRAVLPARVARAAVVVHREELVSQTQAALTRAGVDLKDIGFIKAGKSDETRTIMIVSVQTFHRRYLSKSDDAPTPPRFDWVLVDEAHHSLAPTYLSLLKIYPEARFIGLTATPFRSNPSESLTRVFPVAVPGPSLLGLMERGSLVPPVLFPSSCSKGCLQVTAAKHAEILSSTVKHWRAKAKTRATLVFCADLEHANALRASFLRLGGLEPHEIAAVSHKTPSQQRAQAIESSKNGSIRVLLSVDVFSEGSDLPWIDCLILLRPTETRSVFVQQIGRGLRSYPQKKDCWILDQVGNAWRHGCVDVDEKRELELRSATTTKKMPARALVRPCLVCRKVLVDNEKKRKDWSEEEHEARVTCALCKRRKAEEATKASLEKT